jgi:hypothetical protein
MTAFSASTAAITAASMYSASASVTIVAATRM